MLLPSYSRALNRPASNAGSEGKGVAPSEESAA